MNKARTSVLRVPTSFLIALILLALTRVANGASVSVIDGRYTGERYLSIVGAIEEGDFLKIKGLAATAIRSGRNALTLLLNSPGGDVTEAVKIGKWARELMVTTYVYGSTLYTPGTPDGNYLEDQGRKFSQEGFQLVPVKFGVRPSESDLIRCYSACVLIFYAGVNRFVSDNLDLRNGLKQKRSIPVMGLHRPYFAREKYASLTPAEARGEYVKLEQIVRTYLAEMGAPQSAADRMFRKASNELDLVSDSDFKPLYQTSASFLDEWMISKCGAYGPAAALNTNEQKEYAEYASALKTAVNAGRLRSLKEIEAFSPAGMSSQRIQELKAKIDEHSNTSTNCRERSLRQHQIEWLSRN